MIRIAGKDENNNDIVLGVLNTEDFTELRVLVDGVNNELTEEMTSHYNSNIPKAINELKRIAEILWLEVK